MDKYSIDSSGKIFPGSDFKNIYVAEVVAVGKIRITDEEIKRKFESRDFKRIKKSLERFNADDHAIKVVIPGTKLDGSGDYPNIMKLPNCFPLMPKHLNLVPKVGEMVLVIAKSYNERFDDRFYIGPIISSQTKLDKDISNTALANMSDGVTSPTEEISKIPLARGVYENQQNVVIEGRGSTDIIQRSDEILIRAGKFVPNDRLKFNSKNPGYIQIKSDFTLADEQRGTTRKISVTNIVSERINLLSYDGSPTLSGEGGLTNVNKKSGVAEYINDDKLKEILEEAHPLVFGDLLLEYLLLLKSALLNHVHNGSGNKATDKLPASTIYDLNQKAERLEKAMLSKNIRIN